MDGTASFLGKLSLYLFSFIKLKKDVLTIQLCSKFCPKRKDLLESLALGQQGMEDIVIDQLEHVLINLQKNVAIIDRLYTEHNLHSDAKV